MAICRNSGRAWSRRPFSQSNSAVPKDLGVGRLGVTGRDEGPIRQIDVSLLSQHLRQVGPTGRLVGLHRERRGQVVPGQVGLAQFAEDTRRGLAGGCRVGIELPPAVGRADDPRQQFRRSSLVQRADRRGQLLIAREQLAVITADHVDIHLLGQVLKLDVHGPLAEADCPGGHAAVAGNRFGQVPQRGPAGISLVIQHGLQQGVGPRPLFRLPEMLDPRQRQPQAFALRGPAKCHIEDLLGQRRVVDLLHLEGKIHG